MEHIENGMVLDYEKWLDDCIDEEEPEEEEMTKYSYEDLKILDERNGKTEDCLDYACYIEINTSTGLIAFEEIAEKARSLECFNWEMINDIFNHSKKCIVEFNQATEEWEYKTE